MPDFSFCPQCNTKYRTAGMPASKRLRCKKCQGIFVVPEDSTEPSLAVAPEKKPDAQPDKDAEHAIPAAIGDSSALGRANFKGGVTLDGSPLPTSDDSSASQDTMEGLPGFVEKKIKAATKPAATDEKYIVEGEIARGGMGVILKGADRDICLPVAIATTYCPSANRICRFTRLSPGVSSGTVYVTSHVPVAASESVCQKSFPCTP